MRNIVISLILSVAASVQAGSGPDDEAADAKAQIQTARSQAGPAKVPVLVVR